ncbi:MipA/OmpV family protein [Novosphingobium mangrovi (ex Hu et al. 2023)]|uniref:MipA/OmpV family protein n=1 Tax=Novosphingobium mangrovi (ex Hu et al. 2023) TaxID=2930094 RepID=A0ABT0AG21_9SPHN|nr:MipA/OmpV family protein [Novosphingobium mangrovi (ex Hu et al. 2023)]MCJ1962120.1 MipA/OmpV family protein [Novosphingobium mangrovi (ex Hu et al. 2023)]
MKRASTVLALVVATACTSAVQAQEVEPRQAAPGGPDRVIVGMGAAVIPVYQGSDEYRVLPLPALDVAVGPFFANMRNGIGAKAIETRDVTLGASVTLTPGYRRRDVPEGVDHINYGAGARIFATARLGGVIANLGGTQGFAGGTRGTTVDGSLAYPVAMSDRLTLIPALATTWGNAKNNDRYFGIDQVEATNSGLDRFEPGAGFIDASASLTASYSLTDRLTASGSVGVTRLLGDVHRSPLVEHRTQPTGFFSITYRLGRIL